MNIMDHDQAIKLHAAERYLLDELSSEERDDFEEHYFVCVQCADEVRSAFTFRDNARVVFKRDAEALLQQAVKSSVKERRSIDWWAWFRPIALAPIAASLLAAVTLYQSFLVIPRLEREVANANTPRVIPTIVARPATRGEDPVVQVSDQDRFLQLILDINPIKPVSFYTSEVVDGSGAIKFTVPTPAPSAGGSLNLLLPAAGLEPGRYVIRIKPQGGESASAAPVDEYSFVLQHK